MSSVGAGGNQNMAAVMEARAAEHGWSDRTAFVVGDRTFTHRQVHEGAARTASLMASGPGGERPDRVLLALPDGMELVWAFLGAVRMGAIAIPVNPRLTAEDHRRLLGDSASGLVVCAEELAGRFDDGRATVLVAEELEASLDDVGPLPPVPAGGDDPAYAQYTSGTTGVPKAALHRHGDPCVYFASFAVPALGIGPDDVVLSVSKLHFAYGLGNSLFFPLLSGASAVLVPGPPRPDAVAALVEAHRVTLLFAVPTFFAHLVTGAPEASLRSLRAAVSAGEALAVALDRRLRTFLRCPVLEGLGSTEVGQTFVSNTLEAGREASVGRPLPPYQVAVRDGDGRTLGPGQPGVLWVRGPTVLVEYLGRPEATAAAKDGDWLCTGDRASIDADGFVHLLGRVDDLEMVGGITVAPREIEEVLCTHPGVTEVAVASVCDDAGASALVAFVVTTTGSVSEVVADELVDLARARLAPYKVPRRVHFVDALPRTATGKLRRFVLRSGRIA